MLSVLLLLSPGFKLLFAAAAAGCWAVYLYALRRGLRRRPEYAAWLLVPGEIVGFEEQQTEMMHGVLITTRLVVRFRPLAGPAVTAPSATSSTGTRRRYALGQSVTVRYAPTDPACFVVQGFDTGNYRGLALLFGLLGLGLLGLSVGLYLLLTGGLHF
jgi:Protein of unknown function (DUF3592)